MFVVSLVMCQVNQPAESGPVDSESVPSPTVPVPESSASETNMLPMPEPVEPVQNTSIPAAPAVQSKIAFDELGGLSLHYYH